MDLMGDFGGREVATLPSLMVVTFCSKGFQRLPALQLVLSQRRHTSGPPPPSLGLLSDHVNQDPRRETA
ncbi:hypothetical protein PGT21_018472 [Puccinia graminis f. sp. tritici]|uniref:Uncharacterized protein n=2 Tax=Puccinia graminis f. sp. tritici TaxID=56615 RepID=H6QTK7_PUCGT|nr:uncharacterized protein PGTG_22120 [Puccinia graminis f. sp. tritici CRL 75-36-700-3]EHS64222.1 hypothetical protein PGTG_22120 [Puccinia graminis f. sp. tritici CRL 75-36-700-3]KAA1107571.1 hypothetical protein PGT21_018472 [Puccinia graminis f. sp. tritici]KAA1124635.1 hypothetical protein PGTUg99_025168 [Puccinia graminis f. sp. tritici]